MPSYVKEIKIEFKCDGDQQGDIEKLEVELCDGTNPTLTKGPDTGSGTILWKSWNEFAIVHTNPFCINIGGARYCWG